MAKENIKNKELPGEGSKILVKPLPKILDELERSINFVRELAERVEVASAEAHNSAEDAKRAAEEAVGASSIASAEARKAAGEATRAAGEATKAAEEAMARAEEALLKSVVRRLTRSQWMTVLIVINLAIIFAAVLLSVALTQAMG